MLASQGLENTVCTVALVCWGLQQLHWELYTVMSNHFTETDLSGWYSVSGYPENNIQSGATTAFKQRLLASWCGPHSPRGKCHTMIWKVSNIALNCCSRQDWNLLHLIASQAGFTCTINHAILGLFLSLLHGHLHFLHVCSLLSKVMSYWSCPPRGPSVIVAILSVWNILFSG